MNQIKVIGKVILGIVGLVSLLVVMLLMHYDKPLPTGKQGEKADYLAHKMLDALSFEQYKQTTKLRWTFRGKNTYEWNRKEGKCIVRWENKRVHLNLRKKAASSVYVDDVLLISPEKNALIDRALASFNNDSFWLVAPYKLFDKGIERRYIQTKEGKEALLVTYTSGGTTPGDSYLWHMDAQGIPTSFQLWVDIIPIGGLTASWENWMTTTSGAKIARTHKLAFLNIALTNIDGVN